MFHNNYGPVLYLYGYIQGQLKTPPDKKTAISQNSLGISPEVVYDYSQG